MPRLPYRLKRRIPPRLLKIVAPSASPLRTLPYRALALDDAAFRRTLVVAPHPDDESLGCGGLLALLSDLHRDVDVLFVCDGGGSHANSRTHPPAALAILRRREAVDALKILGLGPERSHVLAIPDGTAPVAADAGFAAAANDVSALLVRNGYGTVVLPWRRDSSKDHRAVWQIVRHGIDVSGLAPRVLEYPVWVWMDDADCPAPGEMDVWRLDIAAALGRKRQAIACHRSQLGHVIKDDPRGFKLDSVFLANFDLSWELFFEEP